MRSFGSLKLFFFLLFLLLREFFKHVDYLATLVCTTIGTYCVRQYRARALFTTRKFLWTKRVMWSPIASMWRSVTHAYGHAWKVTRVRKICKWALKSKQILLGFGKNSRGCRMEQFTDQVRRGIKICPRPCYQVYSDGVCTCFIGSAIVGLTGKLPVGYDFAKGQDALRQAYPGLFSIENELVCTFHPEGNDCSPTRLHDLLIHLNHLYPSREELLAWLENIFFALDKFFLSLANPSSWRDFFKKFSYKMIYGEYQKGRGDG